MTLVISKHPKGVLIQDRSSKRSSMSAIKLRRILGTSVSPAPDNAYLVPIRFAYAVLENFEPDDAKWDSELLQLALTQVSRREAQLRAQVEVEYAIENARQILRDYDLLDRLDEHQIEAVAAISVPSLQGIAIFDEQGTGKTISALCGYDRLRQKGLMERLLIVTPKSVLGSWQSEARLLFGERYHFQVIAGPAKARRRQLAGRHDILATSYETALREILPLKVLLTSKATRYMLVVDESYYVKNPDAQRTQMIAEVRAYCERAVILCGTPVPNSPYDLIQQINIADEGLAFEHEDISDDVEEARLAIARGLDNAIYLRRLKEDVFPHIPKKNIERVKFELQPIQRELYEQAKDELVLAVRGLDASQFTRQLTSFLARLVTLLQICSHPGAIDPLYDEVPAKHLALDRLLQELIDKQGEKVIIWSYFRYSLQSLASRYAHYGLVRIDGSVPSIDERMEAIQKFQHDPGTKIFLGNAAAAGTGITLTAAHHAVYESFSNQAAHYLQSIDRLHRRGQEHDVTYHILLSRGTIEEREFDRILEKERSGRDLLGDRYEEPMTHERFLAELEALDG